MAAHALGEERDVWYEQLRRVGEEIEEMKEKIKGVEEAIETAKAAMDREEVNVLRKKEEQLRDKENKLRDKELKLMDRQSLLAEGMGGGGMVMEYMSQIQTGMNEIKAVVTARLSATRQASKINAHDLDMALEAMKLRVVQAEDSPDLATFLDRETLESDVNFWGKEPGPQQRKAYASSLTRCLPDREGPGQLTVLQETNTIELSMESLPFPIKGKNDELVVPQRYRSTPKLGALLGIEMKKNLSPGALLQAQAEWLLYAPKSMFPFVQLVTDMQKGGVAYYFAGWMEDGWGLLEFRVLPDMNKFWDFMSEMMHKIPSDIGTDSLDKKMIVQPDELPAPKRLKFAVKVDHSPDVAYKTLAAYFNNLGDVANLADLVGFPELEKIEPIDDWPSYFS